MLPSIQVGGHPEGLAAREFVGGPTPSIPASSAGCRAKIANAKRGLRPSVIDREATRA